MSKYVHVRNQGKGKHKYKMGDTRRNSEGIR